jgi:Asp-tRNA(Asn)/Glu-tRNA(Gln) amidotransferase A subunit family amidase
VPISRAVRDGLGRVADAAATLGHEVETATIEQIADAAVCVTRLFGVGLADLARKVREHPAAYHPYLHELARMLPLPTGSEIAEALQLRESLRARMMASFTRHDVLVAPQVTVPGFLIADWTGGNGVPPGGVTVDVDGQALPMMATLIYSFLVNATGNPSLVIPTGVTAGLPVGVQLIGAMWAEPTLFALGRSLLEPLGGIPRPPERG